MNMRILQLIVTATTLMLHVSDLIVTHCI